MSIPTHVAGTFVIHADASFLNGAGLGDGEDRNVTIPKTLKDGRNRVPYVSSQAWKRWLRSTLIAETGWPASELRSTKKNVKGNASKISGELNPVEFAEDDLFGYMNAQENQGKQKQSEDSDAEEEEITPKAPKTKSLMRSSPFSASLLVSIRKNGWQGRDEGFVHLKVGTPLPYTTEFYTTHLQGIFCLDHYRVGLFSNEGDRIELDEVLARRCLAEGKIETVKNGFETTGAAASRKLRSSELLKALSVLRGGAKQAAFGTDVAPKCLIAAGLRCGNPIFNHLFEDDLDKGLSLKANVFREILADYADRIVTPVAVGIRKGYLANEDEVRSLAGTQETSRGKVEVVVGTPREAADLIAARL
jgi:CRISPR-associated protein Cst2